MSKADFRVESFTNDIGQTINPGDDVIFVGTSWGNSRVKRGTYQGVYYGEGPYWEKGSARTKLRPIAAKVTWDGQRFKWDNVARKGEYIPAKCTSRLIKMMVYRVDTALAEANKV